MSKIVIFIFSMIFSLSAFAAQPEGSKKQLKYEGFIFNPTFGESSYGPDSYGGSVLSTSEDSWLKSQIGDVQLDEFSTFGLVGFMELDGGVEFVRAGAFLKGQDVINKLNGIRKSFGLEEVASKRVGVFTSADLHLFGVFKGGKEILKLERKALPIEKEWETSEFLMNSRIPFLDLQWGKCELKSFLMSQDINLDEKPELFSFEGYYSPFDPKVNMGALQYVSLHINDGVTGKEVFSEVLKELNSDEGMSVDPKAMGKLEEPGYFKMSKLFLADFNENDHLDILVWKRTYSSGDGVGKGSDKLGGWKFVEEAFEQFEESPEGFKKVPTTTERVKKMLNEHGLTWRKGFPDKSACKDGNTEPFTFFADPILHE